jgi:hypothetical protein
MQIDKEVISAEFKKSKQYQLMIVGYLPVMAISDFLGEYLRCDLELLPKEVKIDMIYSILESLN